METIDVVLPCLNEAGALPWLLTRMPAGYRPIVADNGSTDGSARIAAEHGATVVDVPQRGFGAACHAGLLAATSDIVCIMDADGSFEPADLPIVSDPVADGVIDLMLGRRGAGVRRKAPCCRAVRGPAMRPARSARAAPASGRSRRRRPDR